MVGTYAGDKSLNVLLANQRAHVQTQRVRSTQGGHHLNHQPAPHHTGQRRLDAVKEAKQTRATRWADSSNATSWQDKYKQGSGAGTGSWQDQYMAGDMNEAASVQQWQSSAEKWNSQVLALKATDISFSIGLRNELITRYTSAQEWLLTGGEQLGKASLNTGIVHRQKAFIAYAAGEKALQVPVLDTLAAETGNDMALKESQVQHAAANKYSSSAKILMKAGRYLTRGLIGVDIADKVLDVVKAPSGQRARVAFESGAEFLGEMGGGFAGMAIVGGEATLTFGASLFYSVPVVVGTAGTGGYVFKWGARQLEEQADKWSNKYA